MSVSGEEQRKLYAQTGRLIDVMLNPDIVGGGRRRWGFTLLVYPFGTAVRSHYVSNGADRRDMAQLFREAARRLDERIAWEQGGGKPQ
ncbi:MAG: hypothetical protein OXN81_03380 [Alphaproteobacteria bacterium]|nr:hypothetical protein [Alphaproteobacteria bacterium]